jgi:hypothetical protein
MNAGDEAMVARLVQWIKGVEPEQDDIPRCRAHGEQMELFKKVGKPARFTDQPTESYTLLFRCPVPGCGEHAERTRIRNQIPVPGERTERPVWATRDRKGL